MTTSTLNDAPSVSLPAAGESLYRIDRLDNGFVISRDKLIKATVTINRQWIYIQEDGKSIQQIYGHHFYPLKAIILDIVYTNWKQNQTKEIRHTKITAWVRKNMLKALNTILYPEWRRLLDECADPIIASLMKKAFLVRGPRFKISDEVLERILAKPYLISDFQKYNAAWFIVDKEYWIGNGVFNTHMCCNDQLENWRKVFEHQDGSNKSLNKTLDNWPRNMPGMLIDALRKIKLREPITNRTKLLMVLGAAQYNYHNALNVIINTEPKKLIKTFKKYKKDEERERGFRIPGINLRSYNKMRGFIDLIGDYPEIHHGEITTLYERAKEWHNRPDRYRGYGGSAYDTTLNKDVPTAKLPKMPEIKGVTFLATVGDVVAEGKKMHHCIASYAERAVKGEYYLFHCDHNGEAASIAITPNGDIHQCYGPCNQKNSASKYAEKEFQKWIRKVMLN